MFSILTSSTFTWKFFLILFVLFSNNVFAFSEFVDKYFAIPNFNLVNEPNLTKILKAETFFHIHGQLRVAYLILDYNPISSLATTPSLLAF